MACWHDGLVLPRNDYVRAQWAAGALNVKEVGALRPPESTLRVPLEYPESTSRTWLSMVRLECAVVPLEPRSSAHCMTHVKVSVTSAG
jgi:hypothetical protein